jgi:hypothetical protein
MNANEDRAVAWFRQRLLGLYLLKYTLAALTAWAFLYGTAVLALRGTLAVPREMLLWGLASLPLAVAPAAWWAWRRLPPGRAVTALLDRHGRCGGLLMAGEEQPLGEWRQAVPAVRPPGLSYRGGRAWGLFAASLAFVALGFLVQDGFANPDAGRLDVESEVARQKQQVAVLKEEKVIGQERADSLTSKLEQVRREASGRDPVKTLESLDHVQEVTSKAAQDASESAARKSEQLGRAETLTKALEDLAGKMDRAKLAEAMQEMAALAKKAATEKELAEMGLDAETLDALMKKGALSKEQMKKLAEALKNGKGALKKMVGKLVKAKLIDAKALAKCDKAGQCSCEGLAAFLKENGSKSDLAEMLDKAGKGSDDRGPGAAKLTFGDETDEDGFKFKEESLPPSTLKAMRESQISGISAGTPNIGKEKATAGGSGALAGAKAGGGSANAQVVLPRHRGAVERFFERSEKGKK